VRGETWTEIGSCKYRQGRIKGYTVEKRSQLYGPRIRPMEENLSSFMTFYLIPSKISSRILRIFNFVTVYDKKNFITADFWKLLQLGADFGVEISLYYFKIFN